MKHVDWIVCEQTNRWAAAIRTAIARDAAFQYQRVRMREVRRIDEVTVRLATAPQGLVMIEVRRETVARILDWLSHARLELPLAGFVALLDYDVATAVRHDEPLLDRPNLVAQALAEAGAIEIVDSPRRLRGLLEVGRRYAALVANQRTMEDRIQKSATDAAWNSLPWQDG